MTRRYVSLMIVRYEASRRRDGMHFNESRQQACRETHVGARHYAKTPCRDNGDRTRRIHVASFFDVSLIYERPLIEKRYSWRIRGSESGVSTTGENSFTPPSFSSLEPLPCTTLTLFRRPNFLQFWRGANFVGEINARFTRCYENRIYVFVNPPHIVVSLLHPSGAIFHSCAAIGNIFTVFCFRWNRA